MKTVGSGMGNLAEFILNGLAGMFSSFLIEKNCTQSLKLV